MDPRKLNDILVATIDPDIDRRKQAEEQLNQMHKIIGFLPSLLQLVMQNDVEMSVRQAGVIYLKNLIVQSWTLDQEVESGKPIAYTIHEQDRAMIRDSIVEAIVHSPEIIRIQLGSCLHRIIKFDFPGRWTQVVDKISIYLQNNDPNAWSGALICLHQLVKNYEYNKADERVPLIEALNLLLPQVYQLMVNILPDQSVQSVMLQKQILKTFHALIQYCLSLDLITKDIFTKWMEICRQVVEVPPPDCSDIEEDDRPEMPQWKVKKWAMNIMARTFERYGSPGNTISKEYKSFADWYLMTFVSGTLETIFKVLDMYRKNIYISPRVMCFSIKYIATAVSHAYSWKFIKPHIQAIIQNIIFPIMSHTDADQELWDTDPYEYIRIKFDMFEDYGTAGPAAQSLLHSCCKTRKGVLPKTMQFIMEVITSTNIDPKQRNGAMHMLGMLAEILLKKKVYRNEVEQMLMTYIFPEFNSPHGHMRARACWVLHSFSDANYKNQQVLAEAIRLIVNALLHDKDVPVKVEAAVAIQEFLSSQEKCCDYLEPHIKEICMELLSVIRESESEDLTNVLQRIVSTFPKQILPIAIDICQHMAVTFSQVLENCENMDDNKTITAMGILNTIETLLNVVEDQPQIMSSLHPIVFQVIGHIFQNGISDFYEETFSLVYDLTSKTITPDMWQMLELIYQVFKKNGFEYFVEMMPALHNYITVDTQAFVSNPNHVIAVFDICKTILTSDSGEDPECHAAKLMEVMILQCRGLIDQFIPSFVELVLARLTQMVKSSELRTMCLQVVIAALYYNPQLLLQILEKLQMQVNVPNAEPIASHFIRQWFEDTDCFLGIHDRKLYVLGLCTLLSLGENKPAVVNELINKIVPAIIIIFDGLKRAYQIRAAEGEEEESEDEDDDCEEAISSDEDEIEEGPSYIEGIKNFATTQAAKYGVELNAEIKDDEDGDESSDDDGDLDDMDETLLEGYTTVIDDEDKMEVNEYVSFQQLMNHLSASDPNFYSLLMHNISSDEAKSLQEIILLAEQKKALIQSKLIEKSGGFSFNQQTVPTSFKFG